MSWLSSVPHVFCYDYDKGINASVYYAFKGEEKTDKLGLNRKMSLCFCVVRGSCIFNKESIYVYQLLWTNASITKNLGKRMCCFEK